MDFILDIFITVLCRQWSLLKILSVKYWEFPFSRWLIRLSWGFKFWAALRNCSMSVHISEPLQLVGFHPLAMVSGHFEIGSSVWEFIFSFYIKTWVIWNQSTLTWLRPGVYKELEGITFRNPFLSALSLGPCFWRSGWKAVVFNYHVLPCSSHDCTCLEISSTKITTTKPPGLVSPSWNHCAPDQMKALSCRCCVPFPGPLVLLLLLPPQKDRSPSTWEN